MIVTGYPAGTPPVITATITNTDYSLSLTSRDFVTNSIRIKRSVSASDELTVGAAIIGGLDFELRNRNGRFDNVPWKGAEIQINFSAGGVTVNQHNKYWIVDHHESGSIIRVECHDAMKLLDEYKVSELDVTFPTTINNALGAMFYALGLTMEDFPADLLSLQINPPLNVTQRALLSWVAQLAGKFVLCNGSAIWFDWYDTETVYDCGTAFTHDLRTEDVVINALEVYSYSGTPALYRHAPGGATIKIEDNPLITDDNLMSVGNTIANAVLGLTYRPGKVEIRSNPALEAGDVISVNTASERGIVMLATNVTYRPGVRMSVTADAEPYAGDLRLTHAAESHEYQQYVDDAVSGVSGPTTNTIYVELGPEDEITFRYENGSNTQPSSPASHDYNFIKYLCDLNDPGTDLKGNYPYVQIKRQVIALPDPRGLASHIGENPPYYFPVTIRARLTGSNSSSIDPYNPNGQITFQGFYSIKNSQLCLSLSSGVFYGNHNAFTGNYTSGGVPIYAMVPCIASTSELRCLTSRYYEKSMVLYRDSAENITGVSWAWDAD